MDESEQRRIKELGMYLEQNFDPSEIWEGRVASRVIREEYVEWILKFAPWMVYVTLTFREDKYPDVAKKYFYRLVDCLNRRVFGEKYKRIVDHSYFSYVLVMEYQIREVVHFHFIADKPLDYLLLHEFWNEQAGFAFTDTIEDRERVARYLAKYIVKCGEPEYWKDTRNRIPLKIPSWWRDDGIKTRESEQGNMEAPGDAPA